MAGTDETWVICMLITVRMLIVLMTQMVLMMLTPWW